MQVRLVNHTPNPEDFIAYIARVSNPDNQDNPEYEKLIRYMLRNGHYSPFEHSYFTFEIKTSRAIAAQMLRHRSFTWQEFSQRYSEVTEFEPIELRRQAASNRQSSTDVFDPLLRYHFHNTLPGFFQYDENNNMVPASYKASELINDHILYCKNLYNELIKAGVAKETARFILPLTTQTTLYMTGSIRSFIHYLALRNDSHAQLEHQRIAVAIEELLRLYLPIVWRAIDDIKRDKERDEQTLRMLKTLPVSVTF